MDNIIFGIRPVIEAINAGKELERVWFRKGGDGLLLNDLRDMCRRYRINTQEVPVEKLNRLTKGNHQGVVARMAAIGYAELTDILDGIPQEETPLLLLFDGVTDVRNFGGIARSALCAGVHGLVVPVKNSAPVTADAVRSSAGALTHIPVCRVGSLRNTVKTLLSAGFTVAAATEKGETLLYDADLTGPLCIVMGSEDTGISRELLKLCGTQLSIPMHGDIGSLNVSAAAAVVLFEAVRQRGAGKTNPTVSGEQ
ncbi:MAG: 23S rRNA (guanosine(2251)-2'-O)-methyltransferase RlmB [Rikenellaceae bacterium]|nr:23S rRNA (guanosine(2251)-2'-O)-methyltransferase RlmB [Rikenellaceae bacterium]